MKLLLCDITGEMQKMIQESGVVFVNIPVKCLDWAIRNRPDAILIRFGDITLQERDALIELCSVLKQNQYTRGLWIIALFCSKNRVVMEQLKDAGVEYVKFMAKLELSQALTDITTKKPQPKDQLDFQLEILCPYLHYSKIDSRNEMTVCGAYLDRMVLGERRLHDLCETQEHIHCEYYLTPRCSS